MCVLEGLKRVVAKFWAARERSGREPGFNEVSPAPCYRERHVKNGKRGRKSLREGSHVYECTMSFRG